MDPGSKVRGDMLPQVECYPLTGNSIEISKPAQRGLDIRAAIEAAAKAADAAARRGAKKHPKTRQHYRERLNQRSAVQRSVRPLRARPSGRMSAPGEGQNKKRKRPP